VSELGGFDFSAGEVPYGWVVEEGRWQHVLVTCEVPNVFLVLVLDVPAQAVHGHNLLDLTTHHGLGGD